MNEIILLFMTIPFQLEMRTGRADLIKPGIRTGEKMAQSIPRRKQFKDEKPKFLKKLSKIYFLRKFQNFMERFALEPSFYKIYSKLTISIPRAGPGRKISARGHL